MPSNSNNEANGYFFKNPNDLIGYLDACYRSTQSIPPFFLHPEEPYGYVPNGAINPDPSNNRLYGGVPVKIPEEILRGPQGNIQNMIDSLRLQEAQAEVDFSREVLVYFEGNREQFSRARDLLFEYEWGAKQPVVVEVVPLSNQDNQVVDNFRCLLRVRGLHAYVMMEKWRNDPCFSVYCPYPVNEAAWLEQDPMLYIQWGYDLPGLSLLDALLRLESSEWVLFNAPFGTRRIPLASTGSKSFLPISEIHNITFGTRAPSLQEVVRDSTWLEPFHLTMELRQTPDRTRRAADEIDRLRERINILEARLANLRAAQSVPRIHARLLVYEEPSPTDGGHRAFSKLMQFMLEQPLQALYQYRYTRLEAELRGEHEILHILIPNSDDPSGLIAPMNPDYVFCLDARWRESTGYNVYMPDGCELFPFLLPNFPGQAVKLASALAHVDGLAPIRPNSSDVILLWHEPGGAPGEFSRMPIFELDMKPLVDALEDINFGQVAPKLPRILSHTASEQIIRRMEEDVANHTDDLKASAERIEQIILDAWQTKQHDIQQLQDEIQSLLGKLATIDQLSQEMKTRYAAIHQLRQQHFTGWTNFIQEIITMSEKILDPLEEKQWFLIQDLKDILNRLKNVYQIPDLYSMISEIRRNRWQLSQRFRNHVVSLLAKLQADIEALGEFEPNEPGKKHE